MYPWDQECEGNRFQTGVVGYRAMYKMIVLSPGDHLFDRHEVVMCIVMCACISHLKRVDWPRLVHFWSHHRCSIFSMFSSFLSLVMAGETRYAMICTQCWAGMILIARAVRSCLSEHLENHAALFNCPKVMRTSQPSTHNQTIPGQFHQDCGIDYLLRRSKQNWCLLWIKASGCTI